MNARGTTVIDRPDAVNRLAGHIADRDAFVVCGIDPERVEDLADMLREIPEWTAYLDSGVSTVLLTGDWRALVVTDLLVPMAVVVSIPKTVPASSIGDALGHPVPADGSQDLIVLQTPNRPIAWPLLFLEAMERVDPKVAAAIYATDVTRQS